MRLIGLLFVFVMLAIGSFAQRPRIADPSSDKPAAAKPAPAPAPAPQTVRAKYEGGVFGYNKAIDGTLTFDDAHGRLLFHNKERKEVFFIPYNAVTAAFADTKKQRPAAATVASAIPVIYALPAHFIKTKVRYLTLQYSDPDTRMAGTTSFKLENKEMVASVLRSVSEKSGLTARGNVYVKKRDDEAKSNP